MVKMMEIEGFVNWGFNPSQRGEYVLQEANSEYSDINLYTPIFGSLEELIPIMKRQVERNNSIIGYVLEGNEDYSVEAQNQWNKSMDFFNKPIPEIKKMLDGAADHTRLAGWSGADWDIYTGFAFNVWLSSRRLLDKVRHNETLAFSMWTTDDDTLGYTIKITKI